MIPFTSTKITNPFEFVRQNIMRYKNLHSNNQADQANLQQALESIPYETLNHANRFKVRCALAGIESGYALYKAWSGKDDRECTQDFKEVKQNKVTLATIYWLAANLGSYHPDSFTHATKLFGYTADEIYSEPRLRNIGDKYNHVKLLAIKSDKGTGKTYQLERIVQKRKCFSGKTLVIGHRKSLLQQAAIRLGCDYYKDIKKEDLGKSKSLAITLDSLVKINPADFNDVDCIIIDECSQVLNHLLGETISKNRPQVCTILEYLAIRCKQLIILDADLSDVDVNFFGSMFPDAPRHRIWNDYKPYHNQPLMAFKSKEDALAKIREDYIAGKKVYVGCNTKALAEDVFSFVNPESHKAELVTAKQTRTKHTQGFINNINDETARDEFSLLVTSPSLSTGVDIQTPFDSVYLLGNTFDRLTHHDLMQQLCRVRNAKMRYSWVDGASNGGDRLVDKESYYQVALDSGAVLFDIDLETGRRKLIRSEREERYLELWASNWAKIAYSVNYLAKNFYQALEDSGFDVTWVDNEDKEQTKEVKEAIKGIREQRKTEKVASIQTAREIDRKTANKLKNSSDNLTEEQQDSLFKYIIRDVYKIDSETIPEEYIQHAIKRGGISSVLAFETTLSEDESEVVYNLRQRDKSDFEHLFVCDNPQRALKRHLRREIIKAAFGDYNLTPSSNTDAESAMRVNNFREKYRNEIAVYLGLNGKGMNLVRDCLAQLGIRMQAGKRIKTPDGKRVRTYKLNPEDYQQMLDIKHRRTSELEAVSEVI